MNRGVGRRGRALALLVLALAAAAMPARTATTQSAALGQSPTTWSVLYRGTAGAAPAVLELTLRGSQASGRLLLDGRAVTLDGRGAVDASGAVNLTLQGPDGTVRGALHGSRSSAPNDDGRSFRGRLTLAGSSEPVTLQRVAQFVDLDVREGPIHVSLRYPSFAGGPLAALDLAPQSAGACQRAPLEVA